MLLSEAKENEMIKENMNVLFVCTGNVFRSMSAEYCLRDLLRTKGIKTVHVSSAGTEANPQDLPQPVLRKLRSYGIAAEMHVQRRLSSDILAQTDLVIAMAEDHQRFIKEQFGIDVPLFNEICEDKKTSVLDLGDAVPDWQSHRTEAIRFLDWTVTYIHDRMPRVLDCIVKQDRKCKLRTKEN